MMNEEQKELVRNNLREFEKLVTIRFDSYEDYVFWKMGLGLEEEILGKDYKEDGTYYRNTKVFIDGKYRNIEAICKIELPF